MQSVREERVSIHSELVFMHQLRCVLACNCSGYRNVTLIGPPVVAVTSRGFATLAAVRVDAEPGHVVLNADRCVLSFQFLGSVCGFWSSSLGHVWFLSVCVLQLPRRMRALADLR